jgi:hypothetical protein
MTARRRRFVFAASLAAGDYEWGACFADHAYCEVEILTQRTRRLFFGEAQQALHALSIASTGNSEQIHLV